MTEKELVDKYLRHLSLNMENTTVYSEWWRLINVWDC